MSFRPWLLLVLGACQPSWREQLRRAGYEGSEDITNCEIISGWAWDRQHPDRTTKVDIFADGDWLTTVLADEPRDDLVEAHKGDGRHGFTIATPQALKDGRPRVITMKHHPGAALLYESPQTFTCPP